MRPSVSLGIVLLAATLITPGASALLGTTTGLLGEDGLQETTVDELGLVDGEELRGQLLVGHHEGGQRVAFDSIRLHGGTVVAIESDLRVILVETSDSTLEATLAIAPGIAFVEQNREVVSQGAQWNGAQWNTLDWDGAQWNGAQWNGAQWNGAQWEGAQWNEAYGVDESVNDPGRVAQWALPAIGAPGAWQTGGTGSREARLCVLDSGVDLDHPDIAPNLWTHSDGSHGVNLIERGAPPDDDAGHGTHVAGAAAATVGNGWGVAGTGNVLIMAVKVLDEDGYGTEANLAWGISWCARNGADVALMALGVSEPGPSLESAIELASEKDVLLVASAGNDGCGGCVSYPASHPRVIAVSAVDANGSAAPFSSRGKTVELAAPGVDILSTFADAKFAYGSGTSQAAAYVAGAAALLRDQHPDASAKSVRASLTSTAVDAGPAGRDPAYGYGLLATGNATRALP